MSTPTNGALMEQTAFLFPDLVVDGDFSQEELAKARAYSESLREQIELLLKQQAIDAEAAAGDGVEAGPLRMDLQDNGSHFNIGVIDGEHCDLPD